MIIEPMDDFWKQMLEELKKQRMKNGVGLLKNTNRRENQ